MLCQFEPYGVANPRPVFALSQLDLSQPVIQKRQFTKWRLDFGLELLHFRNFSPEFENTLWQAFGYLSFRQNQYTRSFQMIIQRLQPQD